MSKRGTGFWMVQRRLWKVEVFCFAFPWNVFCIPPWRGIAWLPADVNLRSKQRLILERKKVHLVPTNDQHLEEKLHSGKLTLQWNMDPWKMYFLLNMGIFQPAILVYQRVVHGSSLITDMSEIKGIFSSGMMLLAYNRCHVCWGSINMKSHQRCPYTIGEFQIQTQIFTGIFFDNMYVHSSGG